MAKEPLRGLVVAHPEAQFFPTAEAARAGSPLRARPAKPAKRRGGSMPVADGPALRVLEDLGEVVKVVTDPGTTGFMALDERFRLELYVRRDALLPVLTAPTAIAFDDGTSYVVLEGAVVSLEAAQPRLAQPLLGALPLELGPANVALSFALAEEPTLPPQPTALGVELGCKRENVADDDRERTRVEARGALAASFAAEHSGGGGGMSALGRSPGWISSDAFSCALADTLQYTVGVTDSPLSIGGHPIGRSLDAPGDRCRSGASKTWRVPNSEDVIVSFAMRRAKLSVRTAASALIQGGGCGMGSLGGLGRKPVKVLVAKGNTPVFFSDGLPAGAHVAPRTKLLRAKESGDRVCVELGYLNVPVCFDKAAVSEIEER